MASVKMVLMVFTLTVMSSTVMKATVIAVVKNLNVLSMIVLVNVQKAMNHG